MAKLAHQPVVVVAEMSVLEHARAERKTGPGTQAQHPLASLQSTGFDGEMQPERDGSRDRVPVVLEVDEDPVAGQLEPAHHEGHTKAAGLMRHDQIDLVRGAAGLGAKFSQEIREHLRGKAEHLWPLHGEVLVSRFGAANPGARATRSAAPRNAMVHTLGVSLERRSQDPTVFSLWSSFQNERYCGVPAWKIPLREITRTL